MNSVSVRKYIYWSVHVCVCMCVHACVCVYVCACVCVCVSVLTDCQVFSQYELNSKQV